MREYLTTARRIAETILKEKQVKVVTHIDADGITSGAIASRALESAGIDYKIEFLKQLDANYIEKIKNENPDLVWFTDLGSGMVHEMHGLRAVITDHHAPSELIFNIPKAKRRNLIDLFQEISKAEIIQLNPHFFNKDGGIDISGAGLTYLVAREISQKNVLLSPLAIVGAVGDLQDTNFLKLTGTNRYIVKESEEYDLIETLVDTRLFGRETRPVFKMLEFASDPIIPGITGDEGASIRFLENLGIPLKENDKWRKWIDLTKEEKRKILSEIIKLLLRLGYGSALASRIIGEVYILKKENDPYLRDAKEFATLLNSCGRYGEAEVGLAIAMGDRDENLKKAMNLLTKHRKTIISGIDYIRDIGIVKRENYQYFHAGSHVPDTVLGTIASIFLSSEMADPNLPIIGFAENENGMIKVSGRAPRDLVDHGLDLSKIISSAALGVGGYGGGHKAAAGASIPKGKELEFLDLLDMNIKIKHKKE